MKAMAGAQKALVLDFGGVISRTLFETHDLTERALGLRPGSLTWRGPFDPTGDALWAQMQANHISERDYWLQRSQEVGAMLGESWSDMQTLVRRARGAEPDRIVRPETLALIEAAKAAGKEVTVPGNLVFTEIGKDELVVIVHKSNPVTSLWPKRGQQWLEITASLRGP